jgi:hypothetical protein
MARVRCVRYRKRYLTKAVYECRRYFIYIPVHVGEQLDPSVDYEVQYRERCIILMPKQLKDYNDAMEHLEGKAPSEPNSEMSPNPEHHDFRRTSPERGEL